MNDLGLGDIDVSVECDEPKIGLITRHVRPMPLTPVNLRKFWEKARKFKMLLGHDVRGDYGKFLSVIIKGTKDHFEPTGLFWVIDDWVGVFYMTNIQIDQNQLADASVHYSFFDRRHKGRIDLVRQTLVFAFKKYEFRRLSTEVPLNTTPELRHFLDEVGFVREGKKRKASFHSGEWYDELLFGILREEALKWEHQRKQLPQVAEQLLH
ncbi:hypothetical protein LCGC14_1600690 [marine sediment metagenome]|uniref:N-acetyltransferase domain-containing protein n=1 Tax=marine sediment metagenome TaxID=412755 RepID=A0A0F9KRW4_9ZZZZ